MKPEMKLNFLEKQALSLEYELPDPFLKPDGTRVQTKEEWAGQREYLKALLQHYFYGSIPPPPQNTSGEVIFSRPVYGGAAVAETVRITFGAGLCFNAEIIRPIKEGRVPVITWNQFKDRHGSPAERELVLKRGYAIAEFEKEQLAADGPAAFDGPLAKAYPGYGWGAIAMWSWGHSRLADYLASTDYADMTKLVATGHSRGGKIALCAAIYDERFAICAANGSGCGGAGCLRFLGGRLGEDTGLCETAGSMADFFPFWFSDEFGLYGERVMQHTHADCAAMPRGMEAMKTLLEHNPLGKTRDEALLPFDLHFLKALIAPRALITTDGLADTWANPFGTQITWRAAQEVFEFLGVPENNALCFRDGPHAYQKGDWLAVADFCDNIFHGTPLPNTIMRFEAQPPQTPEAQINALMDWRQDCLHYSWRCPK